jgi:hypothetical protein
MDDGRFDALIRVLGSGTHRRHVIAAALATLPLAFGGGNAAAKKKKKKCKGKKCGGRCIPKTACCTDAECGPNNKCTNGACACVPRDCTGRECGSDGCGGFCGATGFCAGNGQCTPQGQCICVPNCTGKGCGQNGCGSACKTCDTGETCNTQGQCCNTSGECDCNRGYVCNGVVPFCDVEAFCGCTSTIEGGVVCAGDLAALNDPCPSTEYCVNKYGEGFVCQPSGTGCSGNACIVPCGFVPRESGRERTGTTGDGQIVFGRNFGGGGSRRDH